MQPIYTITTVIETQFVHCSFIHILLHTYLQIIVTQDECIVAGTNECICNEQYFKIKYILNQVSSSKQYWLYKMSSKIPRLINYALISSNKDSPVVLKPKLHLKSKW